MPAYMIVFVDIHDRERFAREYVPPLNATLKPFGGRVIAATENITHLEGRMPPGRTVIVEFPDMDKANRWYTSDAYAPLLALRKAIATSSAIFIPGGSMRAE